MNTVINEDNFALILAKSRNDANKSQRYMANKLGKSVGTIQNWESGYSAPTVIETIEWFNAIGIEPLRYILDFLYPDKYNSLTPEDNDAEIEAALLNYVSKVANHSNKRMIAYCIFGRTGSSWESQLNMICALNHLPLMDRVNIAQNIYDLFLIRKSQNTLINIKNIMPNLTDLKNAIESCKKSVYEGKKGYTKK